MTDTPARTTYREVLAEREFAALLAAQLVSMLGTVVSQVALSVLVYRRTGSPLLAALAFSVGWLPHLFVGTVLAGLADRVPVRRLLVACDLLSAVLVALLVVPGLPVLVLLLLVLLQGCVAPVFGAAKAATLPDLLPGDRYVLGRALTGLVGQTSQILGYALGGLLLAVVAPSTALLVDAASFLLSALVVRLGTRDRPARRPVDPAAPASLARDSLAGVRQLLADRRLRALLLLGWLPPMLGVIPESVAVPYSAASGGGAAGASLLLSAVAGGVIAGELVVARLLRPAERLRWMGPLALAIAAPPLAFVLQPPLPVAAALLALSGLGWAYGLAQSQALLAALPDALRGRGLSLSGSGAMLTQALGFAVGGALAELLPPHRVVALGGVLGLLSTGAVLRSVRAAHR